MNITRKTIPFSTYKGSYYQILFYTKNGFLDHLSVIAFFKLKI